MRKIIILMLLICPFKTMAGSRIKPKAPPEPQKTQESYVTYTKSGGRFGDNLITYMHAKWISYKYQIPLLYDPFPYSDQLQLHKEERLYNDSIKNTVNHIQTVVTLVNSQINKNSSTLYIIPYYPESLYEVSMDANLAYMPINWEDINFKQILKQHIKPVTELPKLNLPNDRIAVAVHLRLGDPFFHSTPRLFLKFPSLEFYIAQIKRMSKLLQDQPMYVYLFTDHPNPTELMKTIQEEINAPHIQFDCRREVPGTDTNMLEDFFALTQFDCLVRPDSNFSIAAEKISDFKIIIYPLNPLTDGDKNDVDMVGIKWRLH